MKTNAKRTANPFPPVYDAACRVLILGSLPSEASRAAGFYYMNPRNRFWKVMSSVFSEDFERMSPEEKSEALCRHGIALSDVILSCEIRLSADASIKSVECTDIPDILSHSAVEKILLNGRKAHSLFLRHFPQYAPIALSLPSTSPANAKFSLAALTEIWKKAILNQ